MADSTVSALSAASALAGTELFYADDTSADVKVTSAQIAAYCANPTSDDGDGLGTTSLKWSDVFLASGAVINFNSGDVTLTHSSNTLTIAGGAVVVDTAPKPSSDDACAIGASGTAFSDLFLASGAVINFNAGDVTLTHSSNTLTVGGGVLKHPSYAFASLPTGATGMMAVITDSDTTTWGATISGSGSDTVLAWYNGTNWTVAGA